MKYYSTNKKASDATLEEAVVRGLAGDKGLYMPRSIKSLPQSFYDEIEILSFQEIAYRVADAFFGEDIPADTLKHIVYDTLSFDAPVVKVKDNIYSLELFHGPTLAFKDVGGRFMARLLGYFIRKEGKKQVNVLVATSGDTGSAVANGFLGVEGIHVYVLYPKGKVSEIQEKQFTTLGQNITAIEVDGTFDDCQALVKNAVMRAMRKKAQDYLPPLVQYWSRQFELPYHKVSISKARSRWGSCSSKKDISLSFYLMLLPVHLMDYVILHELAHTREMNHGPRFWELLNQMTDGKALALRKELRAYRPVF